MNEDRNPGTGEKASLRDKQQKDRGKQTDRRIGEPRIETFTAGIVLCFSL